MSYRLKSKEPISKGIKRITTEQVDKALKQLNKKPEGLDEAVHDSRKRFKKVRAVLRLVRDEIGESVYQQENTSYRDAGREISELRDSYVMVKTLDNLTHHYKDQLESGAFAGMREELWKAYQSVREELVEDEEAVADVAETVEELRGRIKSWPIEDDDFSVLSDNIKKVYKRGRKAMAEAYDDPTPENFHEWRKRVKYLWYHTRILESLWPDMMEELADQIHDLSDYLGDMHDLDEFRQTLCDQEDIFENDEERQALFGLMDRRYAELKEKARPLGERIYTEKPKTFVKRLEGYWDVWQDN